MATKTQICNMALYHLGHESIESVDDHDEAARACRLHYDVARRAFLRVHPFSFATRRKQLADTGQKVAGRAYVYALPNDCLRAIELEGAGKDFDVEGRTLLADVPNAELRYTGDETDPTKYDEAFIEAFSLHLAATICLKVTGSASLMENLLKLANARGRSAAVADSNVGKAAADVDEPEQQSDILAARA